MILSCQIKTITCDNSKQKWSEEVLCNPKLRVWFCFQLINLWVNCIHQPFLYFVTFYRQNNSFIFQNSKIVISCIPRGMTDVVMGLSVKQLTVFSPWSASCHLPKVGQVWQQWRLSGFGLQCLQLLPPADQTVLAEGWCCHTGPPSCDCYRDAWRGLALSDPLSPGTQPELSSRHQLHGGARRATEA